MIEVGTVVGYRNEHGSITHNCEVVRYDEKNDRYVLLLRGKEIFIDADRIVEEDQ